MEIIHKANISQQSGEDWKDVKLILSTGNPREKGTKPDLQPWMLAYYAPTQIRIRGISSVNQPAASLQEVVVTGYASDDREEDNVAT